MIQVNKAQGIWRVTIDRPDKANSLTKQMLTDLLTTIQSAQEAKALILTGTGRVFSAGADLDEARAGLATDDVWEALSGAIAELPCLTIAALNGTLAGGAFGMALACDIRLTVPEAKFFYPVMKLGFLPQPSDPVRMSALIGPARTKMIFMAGQKVKADEALTYGLVDRVVPADQLMSAAVELCIDVQSAAPAHIWAIKSMIPE